MQQATTTQLPGQPHPLCGSLTADPDRVARMWQMTPYKRVAAYRRGELSFGVEPQSFPLLNGEYVHIALLMADRDPDSPLRP